MFCSSFFSEHEESDARQALEREKAAILANRSLIASEKERMLEEVKRRAAALEKEATEARELEERIAAMQSKLLSGSGGAAGDGDVDFVNRTDTQKKELEARRQEIAIQKVTTVIAF
jgi:hypothetical protein